MHNFPCFRTSAEKFKAVGWIARGHPFKERQTDLSESNFRKLLQLLKRPWEPGCFAGYHECEFCVEAEDDFMRFTVKRYGLVIHYGISNLFVPGKDCIYVAPSLIAPMCNPMPMSPPQSSRSRRLF